jgi:hypothetical protein
MGHRIPDQHVGIPNPNCVLDRIKSYSSSLYISQKEKKNYPANGFRLGSDRIKMIKSSDRIFQSPAMYLLFVVIELYCSQMKGLKYEVSKSKLKIKGGT